MNTPPELRSLSKRESQLYPSNLEFQSPCHDPTK